jgi:hypothetical protein
MRYGVFVESLANLAFETSPNVRVNKRGFFFVFLALKPFLDALHMDKFD